MDDYDYQGEWDNFDTQDFDTLGDPTGWMGESSGGYAPYQTPQTNDSGGYDFAGEMNNWNTDSFANLGNPSLYEPNQDYNWGAMQAQQQAGMQQPGVNWANIGKGGLDALGQLFKGGSGGSTSSFLKGLAGLYAAGQEKKSNQYMANQIPQQVNSLRQFAAPYDVASTGAGMMTPGATTMRDAAMQQAALANQRLQNFRADPNSDAGYKATTSQIENILARQAAQHGNRNNFNATAPALLAAKAAAQMQYDKNYQSDLNSWDVRSGANINPTQVGGLEALLQATKYGAQANSPYMDAIGKILNTNSYESNPQIAELIAAINKAKG